MKDRTKYKKEGIAQSSDLAIPSFIIQKNDFYNFLASILNLLTGLPFHQLAGKLNLHGGCRMLL